MLSEPRGRAVLSVSYRDDEPDADPEVVDLHTTTERAANTAASRLLSRSSDVVSVDVDFQPFTKSLSKAS